MKWNSLKIQWNTWLNGIFKKSKVLGDTVLREKNKNLTFVSAPSSSTDQSLTHLLDYIAENENHPNPEDCGGVDYAAIYHALADLMRGEAPPSLNVASRLEV